MVVVIGLWWALRGLDIVQLRDAIAQANPALLALAAIANLASQATRALGWKLLLPASIPFRRLICYEFAAQGASAISPEGAGELIRIRQLKVEGIPATTTVSVMATRKLLSGLGLIPLLPSVATANGAELAPWVEPAALSFSIGLIVLLLVVLASVGPGGDSRRSASNSTGAEPSQSLPRWRRLISELRAASTPLRTPSVLAASLAAATGTRLLDLGAALLVFSALGLPMNPGLAVTVLMAIELSNVLPTAPAQVGTFEAAVLLALFESTQEADALAFALLFHLQQMAPQVLAGLAVTLAPCLRPHRSQERLLHE